MNTRGETPHDCRRCAIAWGIATSTAIAMVPPQTLYKGHDRFASLTATAGTDSSTLRENEFCLFSFITTTFLRFVSQH